MGSDMGSAGKEVLTGKEGLDSRLRGNEELRAYGIKGLRD